MLGFVKDNLVSLLTELPLEKGKQKAAERIDQEKLRRRVGEQMKKYKEDVFQHIGSAEDFDLENANQYIKEHLFDSVSACFNLDLKWQQEQARRSLMDSVQTAAGVKEGNSTRKSAVNQYVKIFLDIIEAYYLEKVDERDRFLAGKTIEEVERLLKEYISSSHGRIMEAIAYQGSFAEYIDGIQQASDNQKILHYRNKLLKFQGREQELQILRAFLRDEAAIAWMAVTGDGGSGKSKLLYQFTDEMEADTEWKTVWLHRDNCGSVLRFNGWAYPCNLLFVVDYAGAVADQIGRWIEMLDRNRRRPVKIRFVLLEREGIGREHGAEIEPMWYQKLKGFGEQERAVQRREAICFAGAPFLKLERMDAVSLDKMIRDYASRNGRELDRETRKWILGKAAEIDKKREGIRPLIVLFTADAVMRDREYNKWDIPALIENILRRYEGNKAIRQGGHWRETVCQGREDLFCALEEMLMFATAVSGWKLEDSDELPEVFRASAEKILEMTADELKTFICAVNEDDEYNGVLQPLEPDLIGEFYVLEYWNQRRFQKEYFEKIKEVFWSESYTLPFAIFWERCIQNYCTENRFRVFFENGMERMEPKEDTGVAYDLFNMLLVVLIAYQENVDAEKTLDRLRELSEKREGNEEIAVVYAQGLFNLSCDQGEEKAEKTLDRLKELSEKREGNEEIALEYAKGLVNLINKQGEEKAEKTLDRLRELSEKREGNEEIALRYAKGLVNLINKQGEEKAEKTLDRLRELSEKRKENEEIILVYVKGLLALFLRQNIDIEKGAKILREFCSTCEKYSEYSQISTFYETVRQLLSDPSKS